MDENLTNGKWIGLNCYIDVPSSGLLSCSALLVSGSLITLWACGLQGYVSRTKVASLCAKSADPQTSTIQVLSHFC